ncbi:MAG: outer membrane beta-barrel protein [Bacteroidales bacterium]|nr:outer membrane beta-barrel protein [Bacteroidales bacterium]
MKKILLSVFFFFPVFLNAQLFQGGIDVGLIASQVDGDDFGGYHKAGLSFVGYTRLNISHTLSLTAGVGYAGKGAHSSSKMSFFTTNLHYAEIPVIINIEPGAFDNLSFSGGLVYGYLISGTFNDGYTTFGEDFLNLRRSEFSYSASVNYKLSDRIIVKFVSNYSILPVVKNASILCFGSSCWRNNNLRLTIQYKIFWSDKK